MRLVTCSAALTIPAISLVFFSCAFPTLAATAPDETPKFPPPATRAVDFLKDIQPILAEHCYTCHGPEKQKSDLRWDNKASVFKGGEHGPVLVPGKSAESRVIRLVAGLDPDTVMPPKGERLSATQIGLLRACIEHGANWPESVASANEDKRNHW